MKTFGFTERCRRWLCPGAFFGAAVVAILLSSTAQATVTACSGGNPPNWTSRVPWAPTIPTGPIINGSVVARQQGTLNLRFTVTTSDTLNLQGSFPTSQSYDQTHKAILLNSIPGAGLRVSITRWSYDGRVLGVPGGGYITGTGAILGQIPVTASTTPRNVQMTVLFEIVVTNAAIYKGGTLGYADSLTSIGITFNSDPAEIKCKLRAVIGGGDFSGGIPPVIPPPPAPTCTFSTATLNQSVGLNPVSVSRVARDQAPREAGAIGEKAFHISATDCDKDARFRIYFTDNSNQGNTNQTLGQNASSPSRNQVGIRLYYSNQSTPMRFGPAPTEASTGQNYVELSAGSTAGVSLTVPFTAQYVMHAGISNYQITAGRVQADATVTIVYP